jgi:hypothetical protein
MIKVRRLAVVGERILRLEFSDGSHGDYDMTALIVRDTEMVRPLADPAYFARCFLELGAVCWPNGFELSGEGLHRKLFASDTLRYSDSESV